MAFGSHRLLQLNAYDRHKLLVNQYLLTRKGDTQKLQRDTSRDKTDIDVIREHHRFLWDEGEAEGPSSLTWEDRLAKKYYDKLFKEYCICDLSRYKENKVALRWRIETEVVSGKGQFSCGHKACGTSEELRSWEVNFAYKEHGEKKNALVKLRLCPPCSDKLNYHHKKREIKRLKRHKRHGSVESVERRPSTQEPSAATSADTSKAAEVAPEVTEQQQEAVWRQPTTNTTEERSRDEEFQEYLEDLFL